QYYATLGGVPIAFALLTLGIRSECRQVLLPALFPAPAILQTVCRPTILLNEAGVQRGEAGEVPDGRRPRRRILSRQQHRQRAPLHVDLVHGAQAPAEGRLLAGTLGLELLDLAAQRLHVARRALDPGVEPADLARAGAAAEGLAGAPAHRSVRPRASQPPNPPSMVPANMSTTTVCGRRNVSRSSPSVWLTSGSSRGPAIV